MLTLTPSSAHGNGFVQHVAQVAAGEGIVAGKCHIAEVRVPELDEVAIRDDLLLAVESDVSIVCRLLLVILIDCCFCGVSRGGKPLHAAAGIFLGKLIELCLLPVDGNLSCHLWICGDALNANLDDDHDVKDDV